MDKISRFFRNKKGKLAIWQFPNLPIWVWIACLALGLVFKTGRTHNGLSGLGQAAIVVWAYLEARSGDSNFRKVLGLAVLAVIIFGFFKS